MTFNPRGFPRGHSHVCDASARFLAGLAILGAVALAARTQDPIARYTAFAVNLGNFAASPTAVVTLSVDRWSTDAERDRLLDALQQGGTEKLTEVLDDLPRAGTISTPDTIGNPVAFARRVPQPDGGERVVMVTTRPIGYWEASRQPRSIQYPFTVVELRIGPNGEGEGKLSIATRITADREHGIITLENYDTQPVMLKNVKKEK